MLNIYTTEIRKSLSSKWFFIALGIGCTLAIVSFAANAIQDYDSMTIGLKYIDQAYMMLSPLSCFKYWIVTDYLQPATDFFFVLLPLLATLPNAWSFLSERKNGAIKNSVTRTSRKSYYAAKYLATFISGGAVVVAPIILNLVLCACLMPAYMPDIYAVIYVGIYAESLWSEIYYNAPVLYCLMFVCMNFTFAGLWASFVMSLSFFIRNRIALMVGPFLFLVFLKFFEEKLNGVVTVHPGLTPFTYLRGTGTAFFSNGYVILAEFALLIAIVVVVTLANYRKDIL